MRCGVQFTGRLEGMLNDAIITPEQTGFQRYFAERTAAGLSRTSSELSELETQLSKFEFSVQVLTASHWPIFKVIYRNVLCTI